MKYYVYEYYLKETNEVFYVGKGNGTRAFYGKRNRKCQEIQKTHDWGVRIVKNHMTEEEAYMEEMKLIKYYREEPNNKLTNKTDGGDGTKEKTVTEEFRRKMSELVKGEKNPNFGNKWSDEQKKHLSELRKSNGLAKGINNPMARKIMCIETGEVFDCIMFAMEKYSVNEHGSFTVAINDKKRTAGGLHWVSVDKELLTEEERFKYLLECFMSNVRKISYICVKTKEIFKTKKDLIRHLKCGVGSLDKVLENEKKNGNEYITVKEYYSRIY